MPSASSRLFRNDWYTVTLVVSAVVHTVVVLCAMYGFAVTSDDVFLWSALGSWVVLGIVASVVQFSARPPRQLDDLDGFASKRGTLAYWVTGLVPLVQVPLIFLAVWLFTVAGIDVDVDYLIDGDGIGGLIGTLFLTLLFAYLGELLGLLAVMMVGLPLMMIVGAIASMAQRRRGGPMMLGAAILIIAIIPFALATSLGIDGPEGRGTTFQRLLVLFGADVERYTVADTGWVWAARIIGVLMVTILAMLAVAGKRASLEQRHQRPHDRHPERPHPATVHQGQKRARRRSKRR